MRYGAGRLAMLTLYDGYARAAIFHKDEDEFLTIPHCRSKSAAAVWLRSKGIICPQEALDTADDHRFVVC